MNKRNQMEIQPFWFGVYLLTASYLLWKVLYGAIFIWHGVNQWRLRNKPTRRLAMIDQLDKQKSYRTYYFRYVGVLFGIGVVLAVSRRLPSTHWLLLALVMIEFTIEVLRPSQAHRNLPDVITLLILCRGAAYRGNDMSDAFRFAILRLPSGQVKAALEEVMHRRRKGVPTVQCLTPLKRCNRYLGEFVELYEEGGSNHIEFFQLVSILHRARWEWALNNHTHQLLNKAQKYLCPTRSFVLGGLVVAFGYQVPDFHQMLALVWTKLFI